MFESLAFWKIKKQQVFYVSNNREISLKKTPIADGIVADAPNQRGWFQIHDLMHQLSGRLPLTLIITENDSIPKDPFELLGKEDINKLADHKTYARERLRARMSKVATEEANKNMVLALSLCVGIVALAFLIVVTVMVAKNVDIGEIWRNITNWRFQ